MTYKFIKKKALKKCRIKLDETWWSEKKVWIGFDCNFGLNTTSYMSMITEENGIIYAKITSFKLTNELVSPEGYEKNDKFTLLEYVALLKQKLNVDIVSIGSDKTNAVQVKNKIVKSGYRYASVCHCQEVLQQYTEYLINAIHCKNFKYIKSKQLERDFKNARCTYDTTNGYYYVNKKKSKGEIGALNSLINALYARETPGLHESGVGPKIMVLF